MRAIPEIVKQLIIINVLFFLGSLSLGDVAYDLFALHYPQSNLFEPWQIVTHMFMHGGFNHILFNMFGLWMFGGPLAQMWGRNKFLFFYFSTGFGAAALQLFINYLQVNSVMEQLVSTGFSTNDVINTLQSGKYNSSWLSTISQDQLSQLLTSFTMTMVGASGALYGVLVAFAFLFPNTELMIIFLPIPIKAKYFVPILLGFDLFFGFSSYSVGPIAHFAHLGGAVAGYLMMWYWKKQQFNDNRWDL
ncbi:MAG: rhomboid family intramembrane serine protease [Flavobacteriaceae bacterium]|jgi:membrane associated rhomboid family serine protease|nr:rhomboid family intramembrane serine protease [Flavobacteriaceae bacterium]MDG0966968.1 rhomboid family intramembrane serine protease [Flavobacteriaceae bacterium]